MGKTNRRMRNVVVILGVIILLVMMLVNAPFVQRKTGAWVTSMLEKQLGTNVEIGGLRWHLPSDLILDEVLIDDQQGDTLMAVDRMAVKVEWMPFLRNKRLLVRNIRLFNPTVHLSADSIGAVPNYQFVLDAFKSDPPKKINLPDLSVNSIIVRNAVVSYDVKSEPETPRQFNPNHVGITDLCVQAKLKELTSDSLNVALRNLSLQEQSGFRLEDLHFRLVGNKQETTLSDFVLKLPHTDVNVSSLVADYEWPEKGDSLNTFMHSLFVKGNVQDSRLTPVDLSAFLPELKGQKTPFLLNTRFETGARRIDMPQLSLRTERRDVDVLLKGKADIRNPKEPRLSGTLTRMNMTDEGWNIVNSLLSAIDAMSAKKGGKSASLSNVGNKLAQALGTSSLKGDFDISPQRADVTAMLKSDAGEMEVKGVADSAGNIDAVIGTQQVDIRRVAGLPDFGNLTADVTVKAKADINKSKLYTADFTAQIPEMQYRGYTYNPISAVGTYDNGRINASLAMDDSNGKVRAHVNWNPSLHGNATSCLLKMDVEDLNPHALHLIDTHEGAKAGFKLNGNVSWDDIDNIAGTISVDSLSVVDEEGPWLVRNITLHSMPDGRRKIFTLRSDHSEGNLSGDFSFADLPVALYRMFNRYEPTLADIYFPASLKRKAEKPVEDANNLSLSLQISDLQGAEKLFGLPLTAYRPVAVNGYFFEGSNKVNLTVEAPSLGFSEDRYRNVKLELSNKKGPLELTADATRQTSGRAYMQGNGTVTMENDGAALDLQWKTSEESLFTGSLLVDAAFDKTADGHLAVSVDGKPSSMVINKSTWQLSPFRAYADNASYAISDFYLSSNEQFLSIDGTIDAKGKGQGRDSVSVRLKDINMDNLISLVPLNGLTFGGTVTGSADAISLLSKHPKVSADLNIGQLTFCGGLLGDAHASVGYDEDDIMFRVAALDTLQASTGSFAHTVVHGKASVPKNSLDLTIDADSTSLAFLAGMIPYILDDVQGRASGSMHIAGPFNGLDLEGELSTGYASLLLVPTGVKYHFADVLRFRPGEIRFDNISIKDDYNNTAILDGSITHNKFLDWAYDLRVDDRGALSYYVADSGRNAYYTTVFADGSARVYGNEDDGLRVDVDARTRKNSLFALNLGGQSDTDGAFILFRDRDEVEAMRARMTARASDTSRPLDVLRRPLRRRREESKQENFLVKMKAHITPDATLKLVMDEATDDHIRAYGSGDLDIALSNDDVSLRGVYTISYGFYALSIQDIIHKNFEIVNGSTVTFDGDPLEARLDITASHMVNSVSLSNLTTDASAMENVRVNCLLRIGGTPNNPTLAFDLELPQGTEEQKTLLRSYTATDEQMNLQFVYLLALGRFYTYDYSQASEGTQGGVVQSLFNSTLSGQINSIVSSLLPTDEWTFSSSIKQDDRMGIPDDEDLLGNMEVQGALEGRLLNNRLLVNGNFGYRDNPMYASNFIGDFDVRYLLIPGTNLWLKGYNKTNDRYFSRTALTQQGIGILFNYDFDHLIPTRKEADDELPKPAVEANPEPISVGSDTLSITQPVTD